MTVSVIFEFLRLNWIFIVVTMVAMHFAFNGEIGKSAIVYLIGLSVWITWAIILLYYDKQRSLNNKPEGDPK